MDEGYYPQSAFLCSVVNEEVSFEPDEFGEQNLQLLISLTRDSNLANRDWATMLLSHLDLDRPDVREALLNAATDIFPEVRGEAICGLARLDRELALPILQKELEGKCVNMPMLEAAMMIADPSLVPLLEPFSTKGESGWDSLDQMVLDAISACRGAS